MIYSGLGGAISPSLSRSVPSAVAFAFTLVLSATTRIDLGVLNACVCLPYLLGTDNACVCLTVLLEIGTDRSSEFIVWACACAFDSDSDSDAIDLNCQQKISFRRSAGSFCRWMGLNWAPM